MTNTSSPALPSNVEEVRAQTDKALYRLTKSPAPENYYGSSLYDRDVQTLIRFASTPTEKEAGEILDAVRLRLREHYLTAIHCDHERKTDRASCSCSIWRGEEKPSVDAAVQDWIEHALPIIATSRARSASVTDATINAIWKCAIHFAANICIQESDRANGDDNSEACNMAEEIKRRLLGSEVPDGGLLGEIRDAAFLPPTPPAHGEGELWKAAKAASVFISSVNERNHATICEPLRDKDSNTCLCGAAIFNHGRKAVLSALTRALSHAPSPPQQDGSGLVEALRDAFPHFQNDEPITAEAIKALGQEHVNMIMTWEPSKSEMEFCDQDGNLRRITFEVGDTEAAISSGWGIPEDADWEVQALASTPKASDHAPARAESVTRQDSITETGNG